MKSQSSTATFALVLVTAVWGLTFPLIKGAVQEIPVLTFVALRLVIASVALGVWIKAFGRPVKAAKGELAAGALLGVFLFLGFTLQTSGLRFTSASNAGFITGLSVALVPVFSFWILSSKIHWSAWMAVAIAVAGLALLSFSGATGVNRGDAMVLLCSAAFALHIVFVGKYVSRFDPVRLTWIQLTVCAVLALLLSCVSGGFSPVRLLGSWEVGGALLFCGLIATAVAYLVQNQFQRYASPVKTALIFACEPVFSALFGHWLRGEALNTVQLGGCGLLLLGMVFAEMGPVLLPTKTMA